MENNLKSILMTKYLSDFDTLKEIAKDDSQGANSIQYPIQNTVINMINWDAKFKVKFSAELKGVDTIDIQNEHINLIEFKNGGVSCSDLRLKAVESIITIYNLLKHENLISDFDKVLGLKFNYYIVLNPQVPKNTKYTSGTANQSMRNRLISLSSMAPIKQLIAPEYSNIFFKKIRVFTFDQFEAHYTNVYYP